MDHKLTTEPALRRAALAARQALPPAEVAQRSEALARQLFMGK